MAEDSVATDVEVEQAAETVGGKAPPARKPSPRPRGSAEEVAAPADPELDADAAAARKPSPRPRDSAEPAAEPERDSAEAEPDPSEAEEEPARHGRRLAVTFAVSCVVIVVLAAAGGVLWYLRAQYDTSGRDAAITVAARDEVVALLTLSPGKEKEALDRVLAGATGGWRQEFAAKADQFTQVVSSGKVKTQATISASAIQSADDGRATVLVSANAVIQNSDSPQGYPGVYRVLMVLERQDDRWLVSDLQFVA